MANVDVEEQLGQVVRLGIETVLQALEVSACADAIPGGDRGRAEEIERILLGVTVLETLRESQSPRGMPAGRPGARSFEQREGAGRAAPSWRGLRHRAEAESAGWRRAAPSLRGRGRSGRCSSRGCIRSPLRAANRATGSNSRASSYAAIASSKRLSETRKLAMRFRLSAWRFSSREEARSRARWA